MAKKDKSTNDAEIRNLMMGVKTATTKPVSKVIEPSTQENLNEPKVVEGEPTNVNTEVNEECSTVIALEKSQEPVPETNAYTETTTSIPDKETEITNESTTEETSTNTQTISKRLQVNMNEEDLKSLNHAVSKTGLKRTRLVNQMLEFALACKNDFIKYYSEKTKEPSISSIIKDQEGRPKFCVQPVKKSRKDNFLLIANAALIDKVDMLAKELEISRNKLINEAILFALESM